MPYKITANLKRTPMTTTATFSVNLPYRITREGKWFVAWCPLLDVSSAGKTREKAVAMLTEAVCLFVSECFKMGTLEQVLKDAGFVKSVQSARRQRQTVSVPLPGSLNLRLAQCLA